MGRPTISAVIPTYNAAHLVVDAIDSALAQTVRPDEIIVVDDGSSDNTASVLERYGDRIRYVVQENAGASAARNHGVRLAQSEYVAFLDADDVWHRRKLEFQVRVLEKRPDLGLIGCRMFFWPTTEFGPINEADAERLVPLTWEQLVIKNYIQTSTNIVRKSIVDALGGFDTNLKSAEDRDLWIRIAEVAPIAYLPVALVGVRVIEGSLSRQSGAIRTHVFTMLKKIDARGTWKSRPLLRRKAYSFAYCTSAYVEQLEGHYITSCLTLLKSLALYPFPYKRSEVNTAWIRPKSIIIYGMRMLHLAPPERLSYSGRLNPPSGGSKDEGRGMVAPASLASSDATS